MHSRKIVAPVPEIGEEIYQILLIELSLRRAEPKRSRPFSLLPINISLCRALRLEQHVQKSCAFLYCKECRNEHQGNDRHKLDQDVDGRS